MIKQIALANGTRRFFGRRLPRVIHPRLKMRNYMLKSLPAPPAQYGYARQAQPELHQMYLNDQLGDCVEACVAHHIGCVGAQNGARWIFTSDQVTKMYSDWGGYVPGDPSTDQGTDIQTALAGWQQSGVAGPGGLHKIAGSLALDAANLEEVRTAIWLFGPIILGLALPDAWVNPFPSASGFIWGIAGPADPNNGHCVLATNYDPSSLLIDSWAMNGVMTNGAFQDYCGAHNQGEVYMVLTMDMINRAAQLAPNGFAWSQLIADFQSLS